MADFFATLQSLESAPKLRAILNVVAPTSSSIQQIPLQTATTEIPNNPTQTAPETQNPTPLTPNKHQLNQIFNKILLD